MTEKYKRLSNFTDENQCCIAAEQSTIP